MENKYQVNEVVYNKTVPPLKLVVKSHCQGVYYCQPQEDATGQELRYLESELTTAQGFEERESIRLNYNILLFG